MNTRKILGYGKRNLFFAITVIMAFAALSLTGCPTDDDIGGTKIPVTGVTIVEPQDGITLVVGADITLVASVIPANATNKAVTWASDDEDVATVAGGSVAGIAPGTATITVTTADGGFTADCTVTVKAVAPELSAGSVKRTSDTQAAIGFTTNKAGTAYYLVQESGEAAPTDTAVKEGTSLGAVTVGANTGKDVTLTAGAKDIYVVFEDAEGNISEPLKIEAAAYDPEAPDTDAPILSAGNVNRTSDTAATIGFTADEAGTAYYLVQESGESAPANTAVKAGTSLGEAASGENTGMAVTLTAGAKDIYVVVEDAAGNISEPLKIEVYATPGLAFELIAAGTNADTYRVSRGTATGAIVIPARYNGKAVTEIGNGTNTQGNNAFGGSSANTAVTGLTFAAESQLVSIANYAFNNCTGLAGSVTLPDSVRSIGNSAFYNCNSLAGIHIPEGVTSIGQSAFSSCRSLTSITIPASVTSISNNMFQTCTGLTSVTIPNSVTSIGTSAFYYCTSLASVTIPASVTSIGTIAFAFCTSLDSIPVDDGNPNYTSEDKMVYNKAKTAIVFVLPAISGAVTIPAGVTTINQQAFTSCRSITSLTIPAGVTYVGDDAFQNWTASQTITVPFANAGERPSGWSSSWNTNCSAVIAYTGVVITYNVTFDADGGNPAPTAQTVDHGGKAAKPTDPTKVGYGFDHWFNTADNAEWNFTANTVTTDITLKAKWVDVAIPLTENQWANGNILTSSDVQWFTFTATASTQYIHAASGTTGTIDWLYGVYVQVYTSAGDASGSETRLLNTTEYTSRTLTSGQTYYIRVRPYSGSGTYQIGFNTTLYPPGTTFTTLTESQWANNGSLTASGEGARQWFTFIATAATQYIYADTISLDWGNGGIRVQVYTSAGATSGSETRLYKDYGVNNNVTLSSLIPGQTYYIRVRPHNDWYIGTYKIASSALPFAPGATITSLTANQWANGDLPNSSEVQWFSFTATDSTQFLHFEPGTMTQMYVNVYTNSGSTQGSQATISGSNKRITFSTLTSGQIYYIKVSSPGGSYRGTYQIGFSTSVTPPAN